MCVEYRLDMIPINPALKKMQLKTSQKRPSKIVKLVLPLSWIDFYFLEIIK